MKVPNPTARKGEEIATNYLRKNGYKIIERNFRKSYGEIDIIAIDNSKEKTLVFVEVKTRSSNRFGTALEAITNFKLQSLIKTAQHFKLINPKLPENMRIDAIAVNIDSFASDYKVEHLENISGF